jgi:hypothetical protein
MAISEQRLPKSLSAAFKPLLPSQVKYTPPRRWLATLFELLRCYFQYTSVAKNLAQGKTRPFAALRVTGSVH